MNHENRIFIFFVAQTALDVVVVLAILFWRCRAGESGRQRIGMGRVLLAICALLVFFAIKAIAGLPFGLNIYGWMNVVFLDAAVVAPLAGVAVLVTSWRRRQGITLEVGRVVTWTVLTLAVLSLVGAAIAAHGVFVEPYRLIVERATPFVPAERTGRLPLKIAVLADIQTDRVGEYEHRAIDMAMAERPDLILLPGDMLQGSRERRRRELPALRHLLGRLEAPGGAWFVQGDCEGSTDFRAMFEGTPVRVLHNESVQIAVRDWRITLAGIELDYGRDASTETIARLERAKGTNVRILMAHRPDAVRQLSPDSRIDLVVAGHTHGGQIVIPGFGPPVTFSHLPRWICAGGLHELDGNQLYISRGIGMERGQAPRIRLFCPPEVSILTLESH